MIYFVYELVDPRTNAIAYVGITDSPNQRFQSHLHKDEANDTKRLWIDQLRSEGLEPRMRILEIAETKEDALGRERHWIRYYTERGEALTNISHLKMKARKYPIGAEYYCSEEEIAEELCISIRGRMVVHPDDYDLG